MNGHSVRTGDKRDRILQAAERVFASKGFYGAKVSDIANVAGVADGTIYLYFKSKDDLLISLFEAQMDRVLVELRNAVAETTDSTEKLRRFCRAYLTLVESNRHAAEVITIELRQSAKFMKEYRNPKFAELLKTLAQVITEGQQAGKLRPEVPASIAARALFGALDELALLWVTSRERFDIRKVADWLGDVVLQGLEMQRRQA
jgi:TetR/AcrR family transcriptional regulator, fatty acid metabolism regulator protein